MAHHKKLKAKLEKSLTEKWRFRLKTNHPDGDSYDGLVTHIKPKFIVLREDVDFRFDSIVILPKKRITGYRDGKYERCANELMRENGEMDKSVTPEWLDAVDTLPELLAELGRRDIWPIVKAVYQRGARTAFYLGPIIRVGKKRFRLHCYDAAGKWEGEYSISFQEIFAVEFDSHYAKAFNDYMRARTLNKPPLADVLLSGHEYAELD